MFIQRNTHCSYCNAGALVSNTEQEPISLLGHNITDASPLKIKSSSGMSGNHDVIVQLVGL